MIAKVFVLFFTCCCLSLQAQLTIGGFVNSALQDSDVKMIDEQLRYLKTNPYHLSPLQRLEFRTQNRELLPHQQEFGLRLTPANPWEVRNNTTYFKTYQSSLELQHSVNLKAALAARYEAIIEYLYQKEVRRLLGVSHQLIADQLSILQKQVGSRFFDADDFVDLQLDLMERSVDTDEAGLAIAETIQRIETLWGRSLNDSLQWSLDDLPQSSRLSMIYDSLSAVPGNSLAVAFRQNRIELAESEYKLEKANINTGFIQTEYDNRRREQGRTPVNIALGITIPIVNPNKGDMAKRQLEVIEAKYELDETRIEENSNTRNHAERLRRLLTQNNEVAAKIKAYETGGLGSMMSVLEQGDPRIVVRFNENIIRLKLLLIKIQRETLLAYIASLGAADLLQQQPLVNYLSATLDQAK
jgi:hypothetical protein